MSCEGDDDGREDEKEKDGERERGRGVRGEEERRLMAITLAASDWSALGAPPSRVL